MLNNKGFAISLPKKWTLRNRDCSFEGGKYVFLSEGQMSDQVTILRPVYIEVGDPR